MQRFERGAVADEAEDAIVKGGGGGVEACSVVVLDLKGEKGMWGCTQREIADSPRPKPQMRRVTKKKTS